MNNKYIQYNRTKNNIKNKMQSMVVAVAHLLYHLGPVYLWELSRASTLGIIK